MPIQSSIDDKHGIRLHVGSGTVGFAEIKAAASQITHHEAYSPQLPVIWDFRQAKMDLSLDEMWQLIETGRQLIGDVWPGKVALVVSHDADYGQGRMYEQLSESLVHNRFQVFRDYEQAITWLATA